jgi:hypothetical protein
LSIDEINERRSSLLRIAFSLNPKKPSRIDFELDEKEFAVIGYAMVHWSFLEHALLQCTLGLAEALAVAVPPDARQDSLRRRLAALRELIAQIPDKDVRKAFEELDSNIAKENGFRQKLAHGIWHYDSADPDILHVEVSRHDGAGPSEFLNKDRIVDFAHRVSVISFKLLHPGGYTIDDHAAEFTGSSYSRSFVRMMTGKLDPT